MYFKNFTFKEIFAHCSKSEVFYAIGNQEVMSNILDLLVLLQHIRDMDYNGNPIFVNSGYRNTEHNKRVGGVPTSQHLLGQAADVHNGENSCGVAAGISEYLRLNDANKSHIGQVIVYVPSKYKKQFNTEVNKCSPLTDWHFASCFCGSFIHVALPNEKYKSFTPSIKFV